jgi:hypothetical protein
MEGELLTTVLAQFPTFMGLVLLAYVQYQDSQRCDKSREKADQRYHDLVKMLIGKVDTMNVGGLTFRRTPTTEDALPFEESPASYES